MGSAANLSLAKGFQYEDTRDVFTQQPSFDIYSTNLSFEESYQIFSAQKNIRCDPIGQKIN
jgi:hypothetical protein